MWLALLIAFGIDSVDPPPRQLVVAVDDTLETEVGYAIGVHCDDARLVAAEMKAKSETANVLVTRGLAVGKTQCRVGTPGQGPSILFDVRIVAARVRK